MRMWKLLKGKSFIALSLFLFSCQAETGPQWQLSQPKTAAGPYKCGKIFYSPKESFRGIALEILASPSGQRMYATLFSPLKKTETPTVSIGDFTENCEQNVCEGGQRLLLPPHITERIISLLIRKEPVTLRIGNHEQVITPEEFASNYDKLQRLTG